MNDRPTIETASIVFKTILALLTLSGVVSAYLVSQTPLEAFNVIFYFTIQSNIIVMLVMALGALRLLRRRPEGGFARALRLGSTLWILLTGFGYHFLLSGESLARAQGLLLYVVIVLHYVTPVLAVIDWLFFEEKGRARFIHAVYWLAYPLSYFIVSAARFAVDGYAPYWFLNPGLPFPKGVGSFGALLLVAAGFLAALALFGLLVVFIDRLLKKTAEQDGAAKSGI